MKVSAKLVWKFFGYPPHTDRSSTFLFIIFVLSSAAGVNDVKNKTCEKDLSCRKLKEQLDALERETTAKLSEVERYKQDMKVRASYTTLINLTARH